MSLDSKLKYCLFFFTILISLNMFFSHPQGDDELVSIYIANLLLDALKNFEFKNFIVVLLQNYHPPGREFVLMLAFIFFEESLLTARLFTVILYAFIILKVFELSKKISNDLKISFFISLLLATTGIFQIQAMVSIHGITSFLSLLIIIKLLDFQKKTSTSIGDIVYLISISFVGFLFSNTFLLFTAPMYLTLNYLFYINKYDLKLIFFINLIILLFYIIYFLIFLGIPYYYYFSNQTSVPIGQLYKYFYRYDNSGLSLKSFYENFKITNFYLFPFIFYFLSLIGTYNIYKNYKLIFFNLIFYLIIFNFMVQIHTGQHFLTYIVVTIPFGIIFLYKNFDFLNKKVKYFFGISFLLITFCWTYFFHIKTYKELDYPNLAKFNFFLEHKWLHNKKYPIEEIDLELSKIQPNKTLNMAGVEWNIYFKNRNYFYYKKHFFEKYDCNQILNLYEHEIQAILFKSKKIRDCFNHINNMALKNFSKSNFWLIYKK